MQEEIHTSCKTKALRRELADKLRFSLQSQSSCTLVSPPGGPNRPFQTGHSLGNSGKFNEDAVNKTGGEGSLSSSALVRARANSKPTSAGGRCFTTHKLRYQVIGSQPPPLGKVTWFPQV